jgi:hypothetical protein
MTGTVETKDILDWCFTVGAVDFGVFGFLYSVFAAALTQATREHGTPGPIIKTLHAMCWAAVAVLVVLTAIAGITSFKAGIGVAVWSDIAVWGIVGCFVVLVAFSAYLAFQMG